MKGHKDHESRLHHHGEHRKERAKGGGIAQEGPHEEATNKKKEEKMMHPDAHDGKERAHKEIKVEKKEGGKVKRRARGGHIKGEKPKHRLDKKARGGSASHPLSGASAENLAYAHPNLKVDAHGKGKDPI